MSICMYNSCRLVNFLVSLCKHNFVQVWNACKGNAEDAEQPSHEMDVLAGHENDVNYVQFRFVFPDTWTLINGLNILLLTTFLSYRAVAVP